MGGVTIYLTNKPDWPIRGTKDAQGRIRVGAPGGWDHSRPLSPAEIYRIDEAQA